MLKVAIETWYTDKFSWTDFYGTRFFMQKYFQKHNIELTRVSISKFNKTKQHFNEYNTYNEHWVNSTIKKKYIPDIIWNRKWSGTYYKYTLLKNILTIPSKEIATISNDKFENYQFSSKYQPFTALLSNFFVNTTIQKTFKGKIVLKPIRASSWKWILLTTVPDLLKKRRKYTGLEELYIVQQFKDFTKWYPKICTSNHDVRFMFAGKNIIEITLRIPKKWWFKSNLWAGWTQQNLDKKQIPKELFALSRKIYKDLNLNNKNIFSMDFAYCKKDKQRYLLEINASPGTWYYQTDNKILKKICKWLVAFFTTLSWL